MKILRYVFYFLLLICLSTGVQAAKKIATLYIPAGSMGVLTGFQFNLSILTPEGAQYGVYQSRSVAILNANAANGSSSDDFLVVGSSV